MRRGAYSTTPATRSTTIKGSASTSRDYDPYNDFYTGSTRTTYGNGYRSRSYGSGYNSWSSWGSWGAGGFNTLEDDDSSLYVKDPESYATPTSNEIKLKSTAWKESSIQQIKELARVCYFKMIGEKDYLADQYKDLTKLSEDEVALVNAKTELYDKIFDNFVPGFSPLEQAIAIYEKLGNSEKEYREDTESIEDRQEAYKGDIDFDREVYWNPLITDQLELNDVSKQRKMSILNKVSIIGDLGTQFKVEREVKEKIVANSDILSKKMLRDYSQIVSIEMYQKLFPNFQSKLLTKDLVVNVPVERTEKKQKIIIILDFSGSMDEEEKQDWVNALLIDRFRYVMKGEAEVFFSYFVDDPNRLDFQHIHNKETVIKFWQKFSNRPNGGGTEVGDMVERIAEEIGNKKLCNLRIDLSEEKPEILVINDGQDSVGVDEFPYKVNAVCLFQTNRELRNLCVNSEGKQVDIMYSNEVTAWSKDGKEKIA